MTRPLDWLREFPTSQALSVGALALTAFVVVNWTVACVWYNHTSPDGLEAVLVFLGAWLGIDTSRFVWKRKTEILTPPQVMATDAALPAAAAVASPEPAPPVRRP
jgi:hypothetical protein